MAVVYCATNLVSGRCYIGKAKNLTARRLEHEKRAMAGSKLYFHQALRGAKLGFRWSVLEENLTEREALLREVIWIAKLKTRKPGGYNLTDGGEGVLGHKHSAATRAQMSAAQQSEATRAKMTAAKKGKPKSEIHRKKISEAQRLISAAQGRNMCFLTVFGASRRDMAAWFGVSHQCITKIVNRKGCWAELLGPRPSPENK